jgi:hypothetical protein
MITTASITKIEPQCVGAFISRGRYAGFLSLKQVALWPIEEIIFRLGKLDRRRLTL